MAHPTRFERVTFAFGGKTPTPQSRNNASINRKNGVLQASATTPRRASLLRATHSALRCPTIRGSVHMASYLWLRGQTWFFQLRPPSDLKTNPRLDAIQGLPAQSNRVASPYTRHLAGWATGQSDGSQQCDIENLLAYEIHSDAVKGDESWIEEDHRESQAAIRRRPLRLIQQDPPDLSVRRIYPIAERRD